MNPKSTGRWLYLSERSLRRMPEYLVNIWEIKNGAEVKGIIGRKILHGKLHRVQWLCLICFAALVVVAMEMPHSGTKQALGCVAFTLLAAFIACGFARRRIELDGSDLQRLALFEGFFHEICNKFGFGSDGLLAIGFECHFWPKVEARLRDLEKSGNQREYCSATLFFHQLAITDFAERQCVASRLAERASSPMFS